MVEGISLDYICPSDKIANLGIISVILPSLANKFSTFTGARIRVIDCAMHATIKELGAFRDKSRQKSGPTFKCVKRIESAGEALGTVLFMVHDGLGRTHQYYPVALIQPYWEAPGATIISSLDEVAALYAGMIREEQPIGPWRLAGYSLAGMLFWRMAQILGHVDRLILIDCPVLPQLPHPDAMVDGTVIPNLQKQFSGAEHFDYSCALTDQIPKNPVLPGKRSAPTLIIAGSEGIVQEMKLASTKDLQS